MIRMCVCVYVVKEGNHENKRKRKKNTGHSENGDGSKKKNWITIHTHIIGPNENIYVYNNSNRFRIDGYYDDGDGERGALVITIIYPLHTHPPLNLYQEKKALNFFFHFENICRCKKCIIME